MDFVYDENIEYIDLRPAHVNGKDGWSVVLEWDEPGDPEAEPDSELLFESAEGLEAFVAHLSYLLKRKGIGA